MGAGPRQGEGSQDAELQAGGCGQPCVCSTWVGAGLGLGETRGKFWAEDSEALVRFAVSPAGSTEGRTLFPRPATSRRGAAPFTPASGGTAWGTAGRRAPSCRGRDAHAALGPPWTAVGGANTGYPPPGTGSPPASPPTPCSGPSTWLQAPGLVTSAVAQGGFPPIPEGTGRCWDSSSESVGAADPGSQGDAHQRGLCLQPWVTWIPISPANDTLRGQIASLSARLPGGWPGPGMGYL